MKVSVFQCSAGGLGSKDRLQQLSDAIAGQQLDLVVCPELFMSGYDVGDSLVELAESVDGPFFKAVADMAVANGTAIVYGYPEKAEQGIYNSALCVDKQGKLVANHRKLLLPPGFEQDYFLSGQQLTLFSLNGVQCAMIVCYDVEFPEAVRAVTVAGAELVIVPTALGEEWGIVANKVVPTRAFENGVWLIYANHAGSENGRAYLGESCIVKPDGHDAVRAGSKQVLITANIDINDLHTARKRLPYLVNLPELQAAIGKTSIT